MLTSQPPIVHATLLSYLDARSLHALEHTSRFWWEQCADVPPPGLHKDTRLLPHQLGALARVRAREAQRGDGRGAILCDEPGLGKSLTTLCVVLRTVGMLPLPAPAPPPSPPHAAKRPSPLRQRLMDEVERMRSLPGHGGTLLVVPKTLVNHWRGQIAKHCKHLPTVFVAEDGSVTLSPSGEQFTSLVPLELPNVPLFVVTFTRLTLESTTRGIKLSPFSSVKWLRLVVDEGHALESQSRTHYGDFLNKIQSERRLLLTGTPTKHLGLSDADSVRSLTELLTFVRSSSAILALNVATRQARASGVPLSEQAAVQATEHVMIRHTKAEILQSLPALVRRVTRLPFNETERRVYNTLTSFVRTNLMMTSIGTGGREQSLLHPAQRKHALDLLRNLRVACCSVTRLRVVLSTKNLLETRELMAKKTNWTPDRVAHVEGFLVRAQGWEDSECEACHRLTPLLVVMEACSHLVCVECFGASNSSSSSSCCVVCQAPVLANELAGFQPGFELAFEDAVNQHSTKEQWLLSRLESVPPGSKTIVFSQFRSVLNLMGTAIINRFGSDAVAEFWGQYQTQELEKFVKGVVREWTCKSCGRLCTDVLRASCGGTKWTAVLLEGGGGDGGGAAALRPFRVNRPDLVVPGYHEGLGVGHRFPRAEDGRMAEVTSVIKCRGLAREGTWVNRKVDARVLLLGRDGSTGLDLSMTTHVFLLDVLWDQALEQQVVSRAWRIGNHAKQVVVEQLVMGDSIEDLMLASAAAATATTPTTNGEAGSESEAGAGEGTGTGAGDGDVARRVKDLFSRLRCVD